MAARRISLIGMPIDLGGNHRGVDMGPTALRVAGLGQGLAGLGHEVVDRGDIRVPNCETIDLGDARARYLDDIARVSEELASRVHEEVASGAQPIVMGGDHSAAIGSVAGLSAHYRERDEQIGLLWVDAHSDMNTPETTPSGNIHGMPVACLLGHGPQELVDVHFPGPKLDPSKIAMVAIRSIDPLERELVRDLGIRVFTMREIDEHGVKAVMREALEIVGDGTAGFHLSYDIDAVDRMWAPGVGTPVPGGLTYREAHHVAELAHDSGRMLAMDLMEVNPVADIRNTTAELGVDLILSAHGKAIL